MKKQRYFLILTVLTAFFLVSCENREGSSGSSAPKEPEAVGSADVESAVKIDGVLYYNTGEENEAGGQCGTMDGYITSSVSADQLPSEDDQSNFGDGYGYQLGKDSGTYEIYIDGHWMIFSRDE